MTAGHMPGALFLILLSLEAVIFRSFHHFYFQA